MARNNNKKISENKKAIAIKNIRISRINLQRTMVPIMNKLFQLNCPSNYSELWILMKTKIF